MGESSVRNAEFLCEFQCAACAWAGVCLGKTGAKGLLHDKCLIGLFLILYLVPSCGNEVAEATLLQQSSVAPPQSDKRIYFVPVGFFPKDQLESLVVYYRKKFKLQIETLVTIPIEEAARDRVRQQLVAEELIAGMRRSLPKLASDPTAILIGFTTADIYPRGRKWAFAFGWRSAASAVVSMARMGLHYPGEPVAVALPEIRLRKMVTKDIGILYYNLPQSNNPSSVLYSGILGIEELDQVGEDF